MTDRSASGPLIAGILAGVPHAFSSRAPLPPLDPVPGRGDGAVAAGPPLLARQIHSAIALCVREPFAGAPPEADALVTDRPGLVIGVVTADCAPVLLADAEAGVVAAAHAGWRGALGGVIGNTVTAMEELGARRERIRAAIGPTIARLSYEVGAEMRAAFPAEADGFFTAAAPGRWWFDLPAYVDHRLRQAGVALREDVKADTYHDPARFFSFRRATHRGQPTGGRQVSVIARPL